LKQQMPTPATPSRLTSGKGLSQLPMPLWRVECQVLRTGYTHSWGGNAVSSDDAKNRALMAARHEWPGFSFCVRSIVQVA